MTNPVSRPSHGKADQSIADEWNEIASRRSYDIQNGKDLSYIHVLTPTIFSLLQGRLDKRSDVLDIGCGTGDLTVQLAKSSKTTVGIDPSSASIEIAKGSSTDIRNCKWVNQTVQDYAHRREFDHQYDIIVANMVLMDVLDLKGTLDAVHKIAKPGATLVWTITHPTFWPFYWGYDRANWYDYNTEIPIESEFRSFAGLTGITTTHVHRPLSMYLNAFVDHNLAIEEIIEPTPSATTVPAEYVATWNYPRFLGGRCRVL